MKDLMVFNYNETPVRMVEKDNQVMWVLADVCRVLGLSNPTMVASRLDEDEKEHLPFNPKSDLGLGHNGAIAVNEAGLYRLILRSDKPEAKKFSKWVTHEVLPAIRKNGAYSVNDERMEIAKLIMSCKSATAVKGILTLYGVSPVTTISVRKDIVRKDSVSAYLETVSDWKLIEPPSKDVYEDYYEFCRESNFKPLSLCGFSRELHNQCGLIVKRRRVNGILVGFYA